MKATEGILQKFDGGYSEVTFGKIAVQVSAGKAIIHKEFYLPIVDPKIVGVDKSVQVGNTNFLVADQLTEVGMETIHPKAAKRLERAGVKFTFRERHARFLCFKIAAQFHLHIDGMLYWTTDRRWLYSRALLNHRQHILRIMLMRTKPKSPGMNDFFTPSNPEFGRETELRPEFAATAFVDFLVEAKKLERLDDRGPIFEVANLDFPLSDLFAHLPLPRWPLPTSVGAIEKFRCPDNARPHTARLLTEFLRDNRMIKAPQFPYSPIWYIRISINLTI
jgi:hypothetical protein